VSALHPALRLLLLRKLRGTLRKQLRRLRRPSGWIFALLGAALIGLWLSAFVVPASAMPGPSLEPERLRIAVQAGCLVLTVLTLSGAFNHRGLYLPREEIELLFSAPVSRRDLVRYRLIATVGRSTFGALVLTLVTVRRMPEPWLAACGVFVAAQTLPLAGQAMSMLLGDAENRVAARLAKVPIRWIQAVLVLLVIGLFFSLATSDVLGELLDSLGLQDAAEILDAPWLRLATLPFVPWARAITASSLAEFLPWFGLSFALWLALFELVPRLPVDYRELSLATSADVARRINRRRRGGGAASASEALRGSASWRVPWLFGRGPGGAIAWRKTCSLLRKARGTVWTSLLIVGGLTLASLSFTRGERDAEGLAGSLLIAIVGTLYLCAGLRFDFREDLESMETVKAWPVRPWRLFLATILPEVVFVAALLSVAILLRALALGVLGLEVLAVVAGIPVVVFLWAAIDNAVFLYLPVRFTPGQEGALHHAGRTMALLFVRLAAFALVAGGALLAVGLHWLLTGFAWVSPAVALGAAVALLMVVVLVEIAGVVIAGGLLLRRFDVARDSG
jgi:hypothetical protein